MSFPLRCANSECEWHRNPPVDLRCEQILGNEFPADGTCECCASDDTLMRDRRQVRISHVCVYDGIVIAYQGREKTPVEVSVCGQCGVWGPDN